MQNKRTGVAMALCAVILSVAAFAAAFSLMKARKAADSGKEAIAPISSSDYEMCVEEEGAGEPPETEPFAIIRQPKNSTVPEGSALTVSVKATGEGLRYQWYFKKKGRRVFSEWVGHTHAAETVMPNDTWDGIQLYCAVADASGDTMQSDVITVKIDRRTRVLTVGDSICRGYRNGERGFVGDLNVCLKNLGVSGATLSTARSDVTNIPTQLAEADNFIPDVIIADGGYNDYMQEAPLGDIPAAPANHSGEPAEDTVMGGLQRLFLLMKEKYPDARKFFVITHRVYRDGMYLPTTENLQGYTQQDLHDAIVACCEVYGVGVIDVYAESPLDSFYEDYRSAENYTWLTDPDWIRARSNLTDYIDADGIHPLTRGYAECYVPLVKRALG